MLFGRGPNYEGSRESKTPLLPWSQSATLPVKCRLGKAFHKWDKTTVLWPHGELFDYFLILKGSRTQKLVTFLGCFKDLRRQSFCYQRPLRVIQRLAWGKITSLSSRIGHRPLYCFEILLSRTTYPIEPSMMQPYLLPAQYSVAPSLTPIVEFCQLFFHPKAWKDLTERYFFFWRVCGQILKHKLSLGWAGLLIWGSRRKSTAGKVMGHLQLGEI